MDEPEPYSGGRNFGHLAFEVNDIYELCTRLQDNGVTILRPPRDGRMAFVRSPDDISIELLQKGTPFPSSNLGHPCLHKEAGKCGTGPCWLMLHHIPRDSLPVSESEQSGLPNYHWWRCQCTAVWHS